ncbi:MAG: hypothetical protein QG575_86 [Euryarchaeota archaeon]|nr:hypothetical protein [Euryarchaeota archaeon]
MAAVFISVCAFLFSYSLSVNIMHTNIQPLVGMTFEWSDNCRSEELNNYGIGPAIITYAKFYNKTNYSSNVNDLIGLPYKADCSYFTDLRTPYYIRRDQKIIIANISSDELKERGYNETQIFEILDAWDERIHNISISIEYQNSLGKVIEKWDAPMRTDYDLNLIKRNH